VEKMKEIYIQGMSGANNFRRIETVQNHEDKNENDNFEKTLSDSIKEANNLQIQANLAIQELDTGNKESIHETMIAMEKATVSFQMMMQIRNKIIEAYHEIMKSSI
jgi:flagellar hook-basal body complex protein FliE